MSTCLDCKHLAPLMRIPKGSPSEIQRGQQGMLARGLAYCACQQRMTGEYKPFRSIEATDPCRHFIPVPAEQAGRRRVEVDRLQTAFRT